MSTNDLSIETLLRAHAPQAPEHLRARVLALQPAATRPRFALPSRRLALVVVPAAAALVLVAAVINGAVHSGAPQPLPAGGPTPPPDSAKAESFPAREAGGRGSRCRRPSPPPPPTAQSRNRSRPGRLAVVRSVSPRRRASRLRGSRTRMHHSSSG